MAKRGKIKSPLRIVEIDLWRIEEVKKGVKWCQVPPNELQNDQELEQKHGLRYTTE